MVLRRQEKTPCRDFFLLATWEFWLLVLLSLPVIFYGLGSYSVVNGDEAFYHHVARQMVESGNWLRLDFTGEHRVYDTLMNAPLQYWARAVVITVFGDSGWTMRGLSAICALFSLLATFHVGSRLADRRVGLLAALIQLTTYQFIYIHSARTGELEPMICLVFTLTAWFFLEGLRGRRGFLPHHLCLVFLVNLKLPLIFVPLLAEMLYFALTREARARFKAYLFSAWVVPLGLLWHVSQLWMLGAEGRSVLLQMTGEASGSEWTRSYRPLANVLFYGRTILAGAFPWSLLFAPALVALALERGPGQLERRALLLYPCALLIFFVAVAKTHPWYINPLFPFLSIVTALWLADLPRRRPAWIAIVVGTGISLALWLRYETINPFAGRAYRILPRLPDWWHSGTAAAIGLPLTLLLLTGGALWVVRGRREGGRVSLAWLLCGVLLLVAGWRVLVPLRWIDHRSEMAVLRERLDEQRTAGRSYEFPIHVTEDGPSRVRYYFGEDFRIVLTDPAVSHETHFALIGEGQTDHDPRARWPVSD